ncbi:hypothetical protein LIX60_04035 [Streptomyces sp. S07_1.15]|uniref:hypothetical protein n=1 Tax=Streptomyces sp. S07_1.15 TaxID=2873925 RepID=UPI001D156995|nr:hypothetical protein [Streptomyces sp. S07_1.15]MCC3650668.1 hypothetical protein [Streptomyces sp. S07_1.15]
MLAETTYGCDALKVGRKTTTALTFLLATAVLGTTAGTATATGGEKPDAARSAQIVESATGTNDIEKNPLSVTQPSRANEALQYRSDEGERISLTLGNAASAPAQKGDNGTTIYQEARTSTDFALQPTSDGSARALVVLKDDSAPNEQHFDIGMPAGAVLAEDEDGTVDVLVEAPEGAYELGEFTAPWAKDANGNAVPTSYRVEGDTVVQTVETSPSSAYPIVADPKWNWGIISGTVYFNKKETVKLSGGAATVSALLGIWLPSPIAKALASYAAVIAAKAAIASGKGKCIKVKSYGTVSEYGKHAKPYRCK